LSQPHADPQTAAAGAVSLRGVRKTYGDVVAVAGIDLDVADGEFFSMLGPSGSGKKRRRCESSRDSSCRPTGRCC
jgi:ABC-type histidine transport system ATPase subunit